MNMEQRINVMEKGLKAMNAMAALGKHLSKSAVEFSLRELLYFRVSQINGCGFCLDMHSKELIATGENAQRLFVLEAWREAPFYTEREQAALAFAEELTHLSNNQVSDAVFSKLKEHFNDTDIIDLTLAICTINNYNRINIALGAPVGTYQLGQFNHN